jgi:hypothetical protein
MDNRRSSRSKRSSRSRRKTIKRLMVRKRFERLEQLELYLLCRFQKKSRCDLFVAVKVEALAILKRRRGENGGDKSLGRSEPAG